VRDRLDDAVARLRRRCDYLEVRVEDHESLGISVRDGKVDHVGRSRSLGGCVRACHRGGWGFASFNRFDDLERFAAMAVDQARAVGRSTTTLAEVEPLVVEFATPLVDSPRTHGLDEKVGLLRRYDDVMSSAPGISNSGASYHEAYVTKTLVTSEGTAVVQHLLDLSFGASPVARHEGRTQYGQVGAGSSDDYRVVTDRDDEIRRQCELAAELVRAPKVKSGSYTVVVDPHLAGVFVHEAFGHLSEADNCSENPQLAAVMKMGTTFGSPVLTIYDSGIDVGCRGFVAYDDEGVPAECTVLIRDGRLVGRLHSRETAARLGERPTGSARAVSYRYEPICRMRNTCIAQGTTPFQAMLDDIDDGLYVVGSHGGCGGEDFSFSALYGVVIRRGRLAEKVRDVKLAGNVWQTLRDIDAVGDDFSIDDGPGGCGKGAQFPLPVSHSAPHIRIRNVSVGGEA